MKVEILSGGPAGLIFRFAMHGACVKLGLTLIFSPKIICMLIIFQNEVTHEQ